MPHATAKVYPTPTDTALALLPPPELEASIVNKSDSLLFVVPTRGIALAPVVAMSRASNRASWRSSRAALRRRADAQPSGTPASIPRLSGSRFHLPEL